MAQLDYYYGIEAEQFSFYRVPRLLIKDERFKQLSSDAKLLYGLMLCLKIAAKSGTAQENTNEPDHSLLVTYSPYDDPQICVSVCIQHGYSSTTSMDLTADVYKIYYGME